MSNQIAVGRFGAPFGVRGWVKVISYTDPIERILDYLPWFIYRDQQKQLIEKINGKRHGDSLIVQIPGCQDRDLAKAFTNLEIYINREQLPETEQEEYYWVDLIGLTVYNCEAENLGEVERLFSTGSNDVLIVKDAQRERLIPYTEQVIIEVDLKNKKITVDWDASF